MKSKIFILFLSSILFSCNSKGLEPKNQELNKDENLPSQQTSFNLKSSLYAEQLNIPFEVGRVVNNEKVITANINELKTNWSKLISDHSILNLSFTTIEIIENDEGLFLKGIDKNNKASAIIELVVKGDIIYESFSDSGFECTVICSGCESTGLNLSSKCDPHKGDNGYYCSSCSEGTCSKSTICTDSYNSILQNE